MKPKRTTCCADSFIYADYGEQSPADSGIFDQLRCSSKKFFEDEYIECAGSLLSLIKLMPKKTMEKGYEIDWNLIKLLAKFLGKEDYETNLFSGWVLRTILGHINRVSDEMNENDYKTFICWLHEEINLVSENLNMTREVFFEIMGKIFYEALKEILSSRCFPLPQKFFSQFYCGEEMECSPDFAHFRSNSYELAEVESIGKINLGEEESISSSMIEFLIRYNKRILYAIIEATYEIFGNESNYKLIQISSVEQRNNIQYALPYHYRKPKKMRKVESATTSIDAQSKKKKYVSKEVETTDTESSSSIIEKRLSCFEKHNYFLPLSEALEATDDLVRSSAPDI